MKSLNPLRSKKAFIRKMLGHTAWLLNFIGDPINLAKGARGIYCIFEHFNMGVVSKTDIIMKSLDPLRAKKKFIRKKLGHTAVSAIKASSVTL